MTPVGAGDGEGAHWCWEEEEEEKSGPHVSTSAARAEGRSKAVAAAARREKDEDDGMARVCWSFPFRCCGGITGGGRKGFVASTDMAWAAAMRSGRERCRKKER